MDKKISINQFAEYSSKKRESSKLSIVRNQKKPDKNFFWYQRAKASIRKSLREGGDLLPIYDGIEILTNSSPVGKRQFDNKNVSILAMERFIMMKLPSFISERKLEILKLDRSSIEIKGLVISLSPEFVFKLTGSNGDTVIGAMKIHICKSKPFSLQTAQLASSVLFQFLKSVVDTSELVDPRYCFTIDVFGDRIVSAPFNPIEFNETIENLCTEIVKYWDVA
jgi:hypothetical protein